VKQDEASGRLTRGTDEDTFILVLSDHGSASVAGTLYINEFLRSQGLLACNNNGGDLAKSNGSYRKIRQLAIKHVPANIVRTLYNLSPGFISNKLTISAEMERVLSDLVTNIY